MKKIFYFGEQVEGYNIPVLNEREVRASAGILFLYALISVFIIIHSNNFIPFKFFIITFLIDFTIRVFVNPKYSPALLIGRLIVSKQDPEYVGAPQKKFAWVIGFTLAIIMFFIMVLYNTYSIISGLICLICLVFLFFESVFGICLGCIFYNLTHKEKPQLCPGNICEVKEKAEIQKISFSQILIIVAFIAVISFLIYFFKDCLQSPPQDLWIKLGLK